MNSTRSSLAQSQPGLKTRNRSLPARPIPTAQSTGFRQGTPFPAESKCWLSIVAAVGPQASRLPFEEQAATAGGSKASSAHEVEVPGAEYPEVS